MEDYIDLKVYRNKKNGQAWVPLPKKKLKKIPTSIRILKSVFD